MSKTTPYRRDIDGLRALAVLAVILFHFEIGGFDGGFTGVDIFFVISGYLIIWIITTEVENGNFSLIDFWERRVRRIIPALVFVLFATAIAAYSIVILPIDLKDFGYSLMAQSVFLSNWWFMQASGYFAAPTDVMPLLHTWTLALEEQFYILFPLFTLLVYPYTKQRFKLLLIAVALASFIYGLFLVYQAPTENFRIPFVPQHIWGDAENSTAAFYLVFPRLWEFLVGGLVALYALNIRNRWLAEVVAAAGLTAIVTGIFMITRHTAFPGFAALLPVLGTAAVIMANTSQQTFVNTLLSFKPFVGIGLISYSLYLWHWPLLVLAFYQQYNETYEPEKTKFLVFMLMFVLSILTYRFVETPIRKRKILTSQKHVFIAAGVSLAVLFGAGYVLMKKDGFPNRVSKDAQLVAAAMEDINPRRDECFGVITNDFTELPEPCLLGKEDPEHIDFVLWGDSHAEAAMPAFESYGRLTNKTGIFFGVPGCPPFITETPVDNKPRCERELERAIEYIENNTPEEIFIVSEWRKWYINEETGEKLEPAPLISETLGNLPEGSKIAIVHRITTFTDYDYRDFFLRTALHDEKVTLTVPRERFTGGLEQMYADVTTASLPYENVTTLDPLNTFCKAETCYLGTKIGLFYRDSSHLSTFGARQIILPLLLTRAAETE